MSSGPVHKVHEERGPRSVRAYIITVSTSRYNAARLGTRYSDESGDLAASELTKAGHVVVGRGLVNDDVGMIRQAVLNALSRPDVDVIVLVGGTGLAPSDVTIEAVRPIFEKEIEGFGELFRYVSYQEIGGAAMLTRATAGIVKGRLIICLPGSPNAVKTGLGLIIPQIPHIIGVARG